MHRSLRFACPLIFALTISNTALAADPVAESMFQQAVELMKVGKFAEACPNLDASQKLEPKSGTLVTLANCNEQLGKTATAWAQYKEAAALARKEGREDYAKKATELAGALEGRISKLRIDAQINQLGADLTVQLDGKTVLTGTFGVAFAIDPGEHQITASAPGRKTWSSTITIRKDGVVEVIAVPQLLEETTAPAPAVPKAPPTPVPPPVSQPPAPDEGGGVPAWAWVSGAVGVVALGISVAFVVDEGSVSSELDDACGGEARNLCTPDYDFAAAYSREQRDFGLFVGLGAVGLVGVGVAIIGIVTAGGGASESTAFQVVPLVSTEVAGVAVGGSF